MFEGEAVNLEHVFSFVEKANGATIPSVRKRMRLPSGTVSVRMKRLSKSVQVAVAHMIIFVIVDALKNMMID